VLGAGYRVLEAGHWVLGAGYRVLEAGYWVLRAGFWVPFASNKLHGVAKRPYRAAS